MKHLISLLFLSALILISSCSGQDDNEWDYNGQQDTQPTKKSMSIGFSQASLLTFAENNITELGIYVYLNDSLVYGKNLPVNNGELQIEVPLGENLKTFAVANAGEVLDADSLTKVAVYQDENCQKEIFMSEIKSFVSDKSVNEVTLELKRMVGQALLQPTETSAELSAITAFDALDVVFNNVVIGYKPGTGEYITGNATVNTRLADGYKASVYSYPSPADILGNIEVIYLKENNEVTRTLRPLDVSLAYVASKRIVVNMPILDSDYLENPLPTTRLKSVNTSRGISVQEYQF
ncbi:hypothetical protein GGR21_000117 [Dysgonomonas hofstadii]|uniref:Lipoprotein n=1 Tax=Dysgonomonas hofstadii TaxID=637886 RepID=A0A840CNT5_9BACT|nr:hypothetical protein [Dysgonomonas hofstadii]MBB4034232.1 hypothetical protein [Dysgonomonas hofstadii]